MNGFHDDDDHSVPSWARPLGRQGYHAFLSLIEGYFRSRDMRFEIDQDEGLIRPDAAALSFSSVFGLQNIAQACRQADREEWRELIAAHFDSIFEAKGDDNALEIDMTDFARLKDRLRARLYPFDITNHTAEIVHRAGPEGTLEVLALDLPTTVRTVSKAEAENWGLDPDELLDIGRKNLHSSRRLTESTFPLEQGTALKVLSGDPFYSASHALILDDYLRPDLAHGVLIGMPKRDVLLLHEIRDMGLMEAVTAMLQIIVGMHRDGPGSLSPYLYWYHDGQFDIIPYEMDDDTLTLVPPEEFVELMDELAEFADLS